MLTLKLYPAEFYTLIRYVDSVTAGQHQVPLQHQPVAVLVLMQYVKRWKTEQILRWHRKNPTRSHSLKMPLPVAKALYDDLRLVGNGLTDRQTMLLGKLDQAIVNYVDPLTQAAAYLM